MHKLSTQEFDEDPERAKRLTNDGPVIISDRGEPTHVLLSIEEYRRLTNTPSTEEFWARLAYPPGVDEIELPLPERTELPRPVDLE